MKPRDAIRARKRIVEAGSWKVVTAKSAMPKSALSLSKGHSIQLGRNWHWRVDSVEADGMNFKILTAFHSETEEFQARLVVTQGDSGTVLAALEYHGTHPGWHCHMPCCDIEDVEPGQGHPRSSHRFPRPEGKHRRVSFDMTDSMALARSFSFFRVTEAPEGAMI
jgi:hypothetical protein